MIWLAGQGCGVSDCMCSAGTAGRTVTWCTLSALSKASLQETVCFHLHPLPKLDLQAVCCHQQRRQQQAGGLAPPRGPGSLQSCKSKEE